MAGELLLNYYTWPLRPGTLCGTAAHDEQQTATREVCSLLTVALQLANSPRARDTEGGALLTYIIFNK